jgi:hypothetical protein
MLARVVRSPRVLASVSAAAPKRFFSIEDSLHNRERAFEKQYFNKEDEILMRVCACVRHVVIVVARVGLRLWQRRCERRWRECYVLVCDCACVPCRAAEGASGRDGVASGG